MELGMNWPTVGIVAGGLIGVTVITYGGVKLYKWATSEKPKAKKPEEQPKVESKEQPKVESKPEPKEVEITELQLLIELLRGQTEMTKALKGLALAGNAGLTTEEVATLNQLRKVA